MKRISFIFLLLLVSRIASAQKTWSLDECVKYAQDNNIQIKQAELSEQLSNATLFQSKMNLLPSLNASTGYYFNFGKNIDPTTNLFSTQNTQTNTFQLNASYDLFNGFQRLNTVKQNQLNVLALQEDTKNTANNVSLSVAGAFLQLVYSKENFSNAQKTLELSQQQLTRTEQLANSGVLAQGALYDMQAQEARDELAKVTAQNQLDLAKLSLQQLMNLQEPLEITIPDFTVAQQFDLLNQSVDDIYTIAEQTQPVIKSAEYKMQSAEKGLTIAHGAQYPSLSLFGSISTNYSDAVQRITSIDTSLTETIPIGFVSTDYTPVVTPLLDYQFEKTPFGTQFSDNFGQAVGLSLSIPIFNNWTTRTNITRSKIEAMNASLSLDLAKDQLRKDVQTAYADAVAAKNQYEASLKAQTSVQRAFDDAKEKFNLGAITSVDYITAQNNLAQAQSQVLQSKFEYIFKIKVLDFYQGKPLTLP